jgi:hypothetical protein
MSDIRPRRFFGLLCAHHWEHWGQLERKFVSGMLKEELILQCKHCGDIKYARKRK